jgi:hypothetical protein
MKRRQQRPGARRTSLLYAAALVVIVALLVRSGGDDRPVTSLPRASAHAPPSERGWERWQTEVDPAAPQDEPQRGHTAAGTPVAVRGVDSFPIEPRNLFHEMDQIVGPTGQLQPFDFTDGAPLPDARITPEARNAIRGKNTWMLWGGGNDEFWNWAQQHAYGLVDFLVLLDSRKRANRFESGMINQPGMRAQTDPARKLLGLYLDEADGDRILLRAAQADLAMPTPPIPQPVGLSEPFDVGEDARAVYDETIRRLPKDGVDPLVYGYPSGVIGLRLMLNPDFFGNTPEAGEARRYWKKKVEDSSDDAFYKLDQDVHGDPKLVRPFRVSMSCAYCHVAPHPLNPPANPAEPEWSNLSSTIGNQYWTPVRLFANLLRDNSFFFHFLNSHQPGTVDTSLISSDHISNSNTMNAIFDLPARLDRAMRNPPEAQDRANVLVPVIEETDARITPRHTPRLLVDGGDSIGTFGSVARVYLNIGTFSEEWRRTSRPVIGFRAQRPFTVESLNANSVYWRTSEKYRVPRILDYFLYRNPRTQANVAPPMPLAAAPGVPPSSEQERMDARAGRAVFIASCAICHSSKQPEGFALEFSDDWEKHSRSTSTQLVLPRAFAEWERFTKTAAYKGYVQQINAVAGSADGEIDLFLEGNYLSTDIRVPVTLVGTNSQRAVGTNTMRGQVWDNFSSEDYKNLPAVGPVHVYNPYSGAPLDVWGNNDVYYPPAGGPGYYRPPSLIGLWATAPYLHNNALGLFNRDPSVAGRLLAFEDGIDKLLWKDRRQPRTNARLGDLRSTFPELARGDPGFIYRTTATSCFIFREPFIRPLFESVLGPTGTRIATLHLWLGLGAVYLALAVVGRARHAAFALFLIVLLVAAVLVVTRLDHVYGVWPWVPPVAILAVAVMFLFWARDRRWLARATFILLAGLSFAFGWWLNAFTSGKRGDLVVGPIPKGTPVSLVINASSSSAGGDIANALSALLRAGLKARQREGWNSGLCEADRPARARKADEEVLKEFEREAGLALLRINKSPDFVLDRGHWFAEPLSDEEKRQLKAFLRTL